MKIIITFLSVLCVCINQKLKAQNSYNYIGHYHDISGIDLEGFYGPNYTPDEGLNKGFIVGDNYTIGKYYDLEDEIHDGYIKYNQRNSNFKFITDLNNLYNSKTIRAKNCKSYVVGVDSFITITDFNIERDLGAFQSIKPDFAEVLEEFNSLTFLKHLHMNQNRILITYIIKNANGTLESLPKAGSRLKKVCLKYFGDVPLINEFINSNNITRADIENFITVAYFYYKYINKEVVYYDINWNRLKSDLNATYFSTVESINNKHLKLNYFHLDSTIIYSGEYSSLAPMIKHGEFKWYYPNGNLWKTENYHYNKYQDSVKTYYEDGKLYSMKTEHPYYVNELTHKQVYDKDGLELLDEEGNGTEEFYDEVLDRILFKEYKYGELFSSYYLKDDVKIYTKCSKPTKIKALRIKNDYFKNNGKYPKNGLVNNQEWNCLVKFLVNPKGQFVSYEIITTANPIFDEYTIDYLKSTPTSSVFSKPKHKREKVFQEVVLPITFTINGYSRTRNNYWMMNMYMQNMYIPNLQLPNLPPPPF
jgi:hypothetical protein